MARCLCSHVESVHDRPRTACSAHPCGCMSFRSEPFHALAAPRRGATCNATHDVARGYGVLVCDGDHSGDGMHHDSKHRIVWAPCGCCGGVK